MKPKTLILMLLCLLVGFLLGLYLGSPLRGYLSSFTDGISRKSQIEIVKNGSVSESKSVREAVTELRKLEAKVQVGISYRDYGPALGDAQFAVNQFLESPEAKKRPEMANAINTTLDYFKMAAVVWNFSVKTNYKFLPWDNPMSYGSNSDCGTVGDVGAKRNNA
jgi:hypothetical protein